MTTRIGEEPQLQTVASTRKPKLTRPKAAQKEQSMETTQTTDSQKGNNKAADAIKQMREMMAEKSSLSAQLTHDATVLPEKDQEFIGRQLLDAQAKGLSWDAKLADTITRHPYTGPVVRVLGYAAFIGGLVTGIGGLYQGGHFIFRKVFPVKLPVDIPPAM